MSNRLIHSSSPYLQQHAHNPVDWYPWGDEAWARARAENKLVLVSIGYSACHWCHVMEREVFENEECAAFMNAHFINIKVDREERPDVDQLYMLSVQLMNGQGGWPLNAFCLPDKRPVYGGTYFPAARWMGLLEKLVDLQRTEGTRLEEYAAQLAEGIRLVDQVEDRPEQAIPEGMVQQLVERWKQQWDPEHGGPRRAPKFPMPVNYRFLLHYGLRHRDQEVLAHVDLTLTHMALGGIYDQAGGGFARYSVDAYWKVPHFEKMLYDNAQLLVVYAEAYRATGKALFRDVLVETIGFADRELAHPSGLYAAALDADSEGEEGRFYVWTDEEIAAVLGEEAGFARHVFAIGKEGLWEHGWNILLRTGDDSTQAEQLGMERGAFRKRLRAVKEKLLAARATRVRPGLDTKLLTSWNALMAEGLAEAAMATGDTSWLDKAVRTMDALLARGRSDAGLRHSLSDDAPEIDGFLEDYAFVIQAELALYSATADERWLLDAQYWMEWVSDHFLDAESGLFWFTHSGSRDLFVRKRETEDNVLPSANACLCRSLFLLGHYLERTDWTAHSLRMLRNVLPAMEHAAAWSHWLGAIGWHEHFHEVVITGPGAMAALSEWYAANLHPNTLVCASTVPRSLPLFRERVGTKTALYVCTGQTCHAPVESVEEAVALVHA